MPKAEPVAKQDDASHRCVGDYRILETLGRGGMGIVYRAEHRGTGRVVALKTVLVPHERLLAGIRREIHALARIRHPGIVRILDEGLHDGLPWYAMELLEGRTLSQWIDAGRQSDPKPPQPESDGRPPCAPAVPAASLGTDPGLPGSATAAAEQPTLAGNTPSRIPAELPAERRTALRRRLAPPALRRILTLAQRLCGPLAFLHGEGLVHRDLKPGNILIRAASDDGPAVGGEPHDLSLPTADHPLLNAGWPVLVDFGLVAQFTGELSREALQVAGGKVGTLAYMAPEQVRGNLVDARADLYALGCILYELLTGDPPFTEPAAPGHRRPLVPASMLVAGLPAALDTLLMRLLAERPRDRLGHADDVAAALGGLGAEDSGLTGPRPRPYLYRPEFAGRTESLGKLLGCLSRAEAGRPELALVGGESGAGKTRLALELAHEAEARGFQVLTAFCDGTGPLHPLRPMLRQLVDRCRAGGRTEAARLFGPRGAVLAAFEPAIAELPGQGEYPEPLELPPEAARLRLYGALADTFAAMTARTTERGSTAPGRNAEDARTREDRAMDASARPDSMAPAAPLLLVLDDLQWTDDLTAGFLEYWLRTRNPEAPVTQREPEVGPTLQHSVESAAATRLSAETAARREALMIAATYRTEEVGTRQTPALSALLAHPAAACVRLGRLEEAAIGSMIGDMLALDRTPELFVRYLTRHSEGNPFFVAEYLRTALAEGLLYRDEEGDWQVVEPDGDRHSAPREATEALYEALPMPRSLQDLVARRLELLTPAARDIVEVAAVLGREPEEELLVHAARLAGARAADALDELFARQVLESAGAGTGSGGGAVGGAGLRFVHDKIREVAYAALPEARRRLLHRAAAEAIAARPETQQLQAELGRHWELAGDPARARPAYLAAARSARSRYAQAEAERLYRAGLALFDQPESESITARTELAETLHLEGLNHAALDAHRLALDEARRLGDRRAEAASQCHVGNLRAHFGQVSEAIELCEQALALAQEIGAVSEAGMAHRILGDVRHRLQGRTEDAHELYAKAQAIFASTGDTRQELGVAAHVALLYQEQGRLDEALALTSAILEKARFAGHRLEEGNLLGNLGLVHWLKGNLGEAAGMLQQALELHRQIGYLHGEATLLGNLAVVEEAQGQSSLARDHYLRALELHRAEGDRRSEAIDLSNLGDLSTDEGRLDVGRRLLEQAAEIQRSLGERRGLGATLHNLASLDALLGRSEAATAQLEEALALHRAVGDRAAEGGTLVFLGQLAREAGHLQSAGELLAQALGILDEGRFSMLLLGCFIQVGFLELAQHRPARQWLERAEQLTTTLGLGGDSSSRVSLEELRRMIEASEVRA